MILPFNTRNPCPRCPNIVMVTAEFSIEHALDCRFGGLVSRRHNEIRDVIGDLASLVWSDVVSEPVFCDKFTSSDGALVADFCVRGI